MRKLNRFIMTLALLIAAVTGAWAADVLNIVVSGTSATIMYDGNASNNPYLGDHNWEKSGNPWDMEFTTRSTITTVTIDGSCKNFSGTSLNSLFYMFSGLTTINGLENLNTANVQDIRYMFARCSSLTSLDLSSVKTASVTTMSQMFIGCSKLTSLDLSSWNTENVETTTGLFTNCSELTTVDLSGWNTANVLNTASMFYDCPKLENIYVGDGWSTAAVTNSKLMFTGCTKLPNFDANKVDKTNAHTGDGGYLKTAPIELTSQDGKVWTLDKMPANNIELQVEYEPTKVTMAVNDKTMGTVEVSGKNKVEWTADTWKGWKSSTKEYTVDDITMASTNSAYIQETEAGLNFYVSRDDDNSTVTISTTGDPFSRIKFTMIDDYAEDKYIENKGWIGNPNIMPKANWTFEGKSAVWEGEATKTLTLQSCTTTVSKITFFKGAVPDGVTVNGDGTFTVAKTATVTLTATPAEGYKFLYWDDDQTNTNPVREVTIESGEADKTYTAVFAEPTFNVTFNAANANTIEAGKATVTVGGTAATVTEGKLEGVKMGSEVKVTAKEGYKFRKAEAKKKAEALIINPVVGQIIGSDGKNYDANATLPDGVKAVAVIAYVDETNKNGLAIALADESGKMNWSTAKSTCEGKTPTVTGAKWCLPSQDQWKQMFKANGGNDTKYTGLNTTITTAGGTTLKVDDFYWSSSEYEPGVLAYRVVLSEGDVILGNAGEDNDHQVRACLAF